jgi:hypothetical protein
MRRFHLIVHIILQLVLLQLGYELSEVSALSDRHRAGDRARWVREVQLFPLVAVGNLHEGPQHGDEDQDNCKYVRSY